MMLMKHIVTQHPTCLIICMSYAEYTTKTDRCTVSTAYSRLISGLKKSINTHWSGTYPWDVRNDFKCDSTAGDGAALRHPLHQTLSETLPHKHQSTCPWMICFSNQVIIWEGNVIVSDCFYPSCLGATHLSSGDVDTDAFPEHQLHVGGVAELHHRADRQVHPLIGRRHAAQLGTLVHRRVPGGLHLHLMTSQSRGQWMAKIVPTCTI